MELPHKIRRLDAQSYAIREGDRPDRCAVLLEGYAIRHKLTGEGARQILAICIPGEALDFQNMFLEESDHNVQMLTRAVMAEVPRAALQELVLSHAEIGRAVMITILVESSIFREWAVNIGQRDSRSRIAHLLCEFAYRINAHGLSPDGLYELPMTQEQLADATALTAVHINRTLKALEKDGLIERPNPRSIRVGDWRKLAEVGDFDTNYLHLRENERLLG
jgi:CRP-like cAMP-binding protein